MLERKTKMRGKTNTITINGRTYDAATGKAVGGHAPKTPSSSTHKIAVTDASGDTSSKSSVSVPVVSARSSSSPKKRFTSDMPQNMLAASNAPKLLCATW